MSSSSKSSQVIMSSIYSLKVLRKVSFGLIPRKNSILASVWEPYFLIRRKAELLRSVSKLPLFPLVIDLYFSREIICVDSYWNDTYSLLVTWYFLQSMNTVL